MKTVDSRKLYRKVEAKRASRARACPHIAKDKESGPCEWHHTFCLHPSRPDPKVVGRYCHCELVHTGHCDLGIIRDTP